MKSFDYCGYQIQPDLPILRRYSEVGRPQLDLDGRDRQQPEPATTGVFYAEQVPAILAIIDGHLDRVDGALCNLEPSSIRALAV